MPTINDAIVVSGSGYSTEGNGGRKLVRLDNGWLVATAKKTNYIYFYVFKDNGQSFSQLCYVNDSYFVSGQDYSIANKGNYVYLIYGVSSQIQFKYFDATTVSNVNINAGNSYVESVAQNAIGNVSLTINEAKTELHAAWASKNSTYQNSFNIRYAKGTINADGTVTWGAVEQVTSMNVSGSNIANPTIIYTGSNAFVFAEFANGVARAIVCYSKQFTTRAYASSGDWYDKSVYDNITSYTQSSPSAIFVPQSINGLANGIQATAWMGKDATSNDEYYIHFSKSMDGGTTWSTPSKLYLGSYPSITASTNSKLFITYVEDGATKYIESADNGDSWSTPTRIGTGTYPSSLVNFGINIDVPLTIRRTVNEVFFSGSWSVETISPPIGERGKILNRQNMLTYNITSESTIGTVTEKINGVVVGTKTLTSGQNTTVNITQAQWDAIPYGKYRNNSAGRNTIEIVTSNNTFTYTFEKWFDNTLDVISATKAVKDSRDYYLPSAKKILSDAINSKGGSTTPTDSIESMANQVSSGSGVKRKEGNSISTATLESFTNGGGGTVTSYSITLDFSVLGFTPKTIIYFNNSKSTQVASLYTSEKYYINGNSYADVLTTSTNGASAIHLRAITDNQTIKLPVTLQATTIKWIAYE